MSTRRGTLIAMRLVQATAGRKVSVTLFGPRLFCAVCGLGFRDLVRPELGLVGNSSGGAFLVYSAFVCGRSFLDAILRTASRTSLGILVASGQRKQCRHDRH